MNTPGGRLVADACDQQPFEPRELGLRVVLSGHFCVSLHMSHARRKQASIKLLEYLLEAQIKTKQKPKICRGRFDNTFFLSYLGDKGQLIGGGDLTKCECISDKEYSFEPAYERVGEMDSGDINTEDFSTSDGAIIGGVFMLDR